MKWLLFILLLILTIGTALADDSIFLNRETRSKTEAEILQEALNLGEGQTEAQENTADIAAYYYRECLSAPQEHVSAEAKHVLCACTAGQMQAHMRDDQARLLFEDTTKGQRARDTFRKNIYAPCMAEPAYDITYDNCMNDPYTNENLRKAPAVCACLAHEIEEFTRTNAMAMFGGWYNKEKSYSIATLIGSPLFSSESGRMLKYCLRKHEYGWN